MPKTALPRFGMRGLLDYSSLTMPSLPIPRMLPDRIFIDEAQEDPTLGLRSILSLAVCLRISTCLKNSTL